jgi:superfamily II DNA/RNA helicase
VHTSASAERGSAPASRNSTPHSSTPHSSTPRSSAPGTDGAKRPARRRRRGGSGSGQGAAAAAPAQQRDQVLAAPVAAQIAAPVAAPVATGSGRGFADLGVPADLVRALSAQGLVDAFPIQVATLPDTLRGRDVLGRGRTGSGKTLAFAIPTVARLAAAGRRPQPKRPRALVLAPTRELANQIRATLEPLASAAGLRTAVVFGGVGQNPQVTALRNGVDVLIACPGRLEDLMKQGHCDLGAVEVTVLDEADHMADLGFLPGVKRIMDRTPQQGQRMLFSATLDNGVDVLVKRYLSDPLTHSVDSASAPPPAMTHHVLAVQAADKPALVRELASGTGRSLLFMRTKHSAKKLAKQLTAAGIPAVDLHGNLSQNAREKNLAAFTDGSTRVLVATDIAARGIHVDEVELVVHVDPPSEHKAYLHRSGRTARAGASGVVVTLMTPDQKRDVADLVRLARINPTTTAVHPGHQAVQTLVGEKADFVQPAPVQEAAPQGGGGGGGRGRGRGRSGGGQQSTPKQSGQQVQRQQAPRSRIAGGPPVKSAGRKRSAADFSSRGFR